MSLAIFLIFLAVFFLGLQTAWVFCKECAPKPIILNYIPAELHGIIILANAVLVFPVTISFQFIYFNLQTQQTYGADLSQLQIIVTLLYLCLLSLGITAILKKIKERNAGKRIT